MRILGKRKTKKRKKRQSTEEQRYRSAELRRKRYMEDALVEMAEKDPALKRQLVAQTFGYTLPDPAEEQLRELRAVANTLDLQRIRNDRELADVVNTLAVQRIKDDPELADKVANAKIYQMMKAEGLTLDEEEGRDRPSSISQYITRVEEINRFKEVMGIRKPGLLDAFTHPEVVKAILSFVASVWGGKDASNTGETTLLVQLNGETQRISMSEFERLLIEGRLRLVEAEEPPKSSGSNSSDETQPELGVPDKANGGGNTSAGDANSRE